VEVRAGLPDTPPGPQPRAKPAGGRKCGKQKAESRKHGARPRAKPSGVRALQSGGGQRRTAVRRYGRPTTKAGRAGSKKPIARVSHRERRHSGGEPAATPGPVTSRQAGFGVRRQSEAATALSAARDVQERQPLPEPKRCPAPLATTLQSDVPEAARQTLSTAPVTDAAPDSGPPGLGGRWRSGAVLHQMGLQPVLVEKVLERARLKHGEEPPAVLGDELALARTALASFWRAAPDAEGRSPAIHAFIGPPGSGKTTVLCKWLAKSVLTERRAARVWRLDSRGPNFAGPLDFYAEILGVRVEREWKGAAGLAGCQRAFVDLPGVNLQDTTAVEQLQAQLAGLEGAQMHLVLNAAYEVPVLLAQARAFDDWPLSDLILTHLDEEKRLGKLWNFLLGTKFTLRFLSGGQNVPGDFSVATPDLLIPQ